MSVNKMGELLIKGSKKNEKHETNIGLVRLVPCVIWGLEFEEE